MDLEQALAQILDLKDKLNEAQHNIDDLSTLRTKYETENKKLSEDLRLSKERSLDLFLKLEQQDVNPTIITPNPQSDKSGSNENTPPVDYDKLWEDL